MKGCDKDDFAVAGVTQRPNAVFVVPEVKSRLIFFVLNVCRIY